MQTPSDEVSKSRDDDLIHQPLPGYPRQHEGEMVFLAHWQELMSRESLSLILQGVPDAPTQRMATVCATFFCWLGTNCGQAFLQTAQRAAQRADRDNKSQRLAWLFAWTGENIRKHQSSGGIRLLESILAEPKHRVTAQDWQATRDGIGHLKTLPLLSADDYEVIDALVMFLATGKGQHMLRLSLMALMRTHAARHHRTREFLMAVAEPAIKPQVLDEPSMDSMG